MKLNETTPYQNLDPNLILEAIESLGFHCTGSLLALNSYENRVYQVGIEEQAPVIAKFYRPHRWSNEIILEEHQFSLELMELEIPVVAPLQKDSVSLHEHQGYRFAVFPRWGGRALELDREDQLAWMGRFIGRLHAVGACKKFAFRPQLTIQTYGHNSYQYLIENNFVPPEYKAQYCHIANAVLEKIDECFKAVGKINYIRLHGDMHPGNVLWDDGGPHIVDLDDCVMGPAIQDLWMMLSGDAVQKKLQLNHILQGYREFFDFNYREIHLIESLRTLRMLCYSAWIASRWNDPAFTTNFSWFNTPRYWQEQISHLQEQNLVLEETQLIL